VDQIAADLERRDRADASRTASPMRPAADAVTIDTSDRSIEDVVTAVLELVPDRS
jgi:cytidylate kinase